jgi:hypothetical protein
MRQLFSIFSSIPKRAMLLRNLRERWYIGDYALSILKGLRWHLYDESNIFQMEVTPNTSKQLVSPISPYAALHFGLRQDFWGIKPVRAAIVCSHRPVRGHVVIFDPYTEDPDLLGSVQLLDLNAKTRVSIGRLARATSRRLFE